MYIYNLYRLLRLKLTEKMDYLEGLIEWKKFEATNSHW
jgi:hypothetical protein